MKNLIKCFTGLSVKKQNMIIIVCSTIISLFFCELGLRILKINESYTEAKGLGYHSLFTPTFFPYPANTTIVTKNNEFIGETKTNSLGYNDSEWSLEKNKYRVACLGDSFTEGIGASKDSNFSKNLARVIDSIEVMNWGKSGSDPFYEFKTLTEEIIPYKPDMVIACFNESDINETIIRGGFERFSTNGNISYRPTPWWEPIYVKSYLFRSILHSIFRYDWRLIGGPRTIRKEEQIARIKITACIDSMAQICDDKGIRFVTVFHPGSYEFIWGDSLKLNPVMHTINCDIERFDMMVFLKSKGVNRKNVYNFYWRKDLHHNNRGYGLFTEGLTSLF